MNKKATLTICARFRLRGHDVCLHILQSYLSVSEPQKDRWEQQQQQQQDPGPHVAAQPEESQPLGWTFSTWASNSPETAPSLARPGVVYWPLLRGAHW